MPKPICFMVMPFGTKPTGAPKPAPAKVDFDALWQKALRPVIEDLGYEPVRADQDLGALIIKDMLERLFFSDLIVADLTIPNGNVYYEVGVRHAAKKTGCVLVSADWSHQLFDVQQMTQIRYPLAEGTITDETAAGIRDAVTDTAAKMVDTETPMFQTLPGYPEKVEADRTTVLRKFLEELSNFQAEVAAVRSASESERQSKAEELRDRHPAKDTKIENVALELVYVLRDFVGWQETRDYIEALADPIKKMPIFEEQRLLAASKAGDPTEAIGGLEELINAFGDSSERQGLLGGRYKRLMRDANNPRDQQRYLSKAIEHYWRGMELDLNDYFPSCNLPSLYRQRGRKGDDEKARAAATVARLACERALSIGTDDEWTRQTLLGLAFFEGDIDVVEEIIDRVIDEGPASWNLETTINDLEEIVSTTKDETLRDELSNALSRLR